MLNVTSMEKGRSPDKICVWSTNGPHLKQGRKMLKIRRSAARCSARRAGEDVNGVNSDEWLYGSYVADAQKKTENTKAGLFACLHCGIVAVL